MGIGFWFLDSIFVIKIFYCFYFLEKMFPKLCITYSNVHSNGVATSKKSPFF